MLLNFRNLDSAIDMGYANTFSNGGYLLSASTVYGFAGDAAHIGSYEPAYFYLYGSNITVDPGTNLPTGGMIHTLNINFDTYSGAGIDSHIDFSISFYDAEIPLTSIISDPAADDSAAADKFWSAFLSGNDEILAPDRGNVKIFGDFFQVKSTDSFNDVRTGGEDTITATTASPYGYYDSPADYSFLIGDALSVTGTFAGGVSYSGSLTGGNDTITMTGPLLYAGIVGDVSSVGIWGILAGGNDVITSSADRDPLGDQSTGQIFGDVEYSSGTVTGGADTITGSNFAFLDEIIAGDIHTDSSTVSQGGNDLISGRAGHDFIAGDDHSAEGAFATGGADIIHGGEDADIAAGDMLRQEASYGGTGTSLVDATVSGGNDTVYGDGGDDILAGDVYFLQVASNGTMAGGNDSLYGGDGNDQLFGDVAVYSLDAAATLVESGGNDTLNGGAGADMMGDGLSNDIFIVDNAGDMVQEAAGAGNDTVLAALSYSLSAGQSVDWLATTGVAGTAPIMLVGNELAQMIAGNNGANVLMGGGGADTMQGVGGNDTYFNVTTAARVLEGSGQGTDSVYASESYALLAGQHIEWLGTSSAAGTAAIALTGNELAQSIYGNNGANVLNGGAGADTMYGFGGNDAYIADTAGDRVFETSGQGSDSVYAGGNFSLLAGQSVEWLGTTGVAGTAAINLFGNDIAQAVYGNHGNNVLNGGAGADTIYTGNGSDTVYFNTALGGSNIDKISDFSVAADTIGLGAGRFAALGPSVSATEFRIGTVAADANDYLIYNSTTGALSYDANGAGGAAAIQFATLAPGLALTSADFAII
ncbi:hypothetical protein BH10PSE7_BH10PSE7_31290 [soil metagenome]